MGIGLPPGRGVKNLVRVVHAALAGDEHERIRGSAFLFRRIEPREPVEQLGHSEVNLAVGAAAKRRRQTVGVIAVPLEPLRLLAKIPLQASDRAVATHACDPASLGRDFETSVHVAQDAESRTPCVGRLLFVHHGTPVPWESPNL